MFSNGSSIPVTMNVAPTGSANGGFGGFGDNGAWWIIILIILFGGWGYGNGNWGGFGGGQSTSVYEGYVLNNDFSQLSKQISDTYNMTDRKFEGISNGICSLGYDQLAQMNGISNTVTSVGNAIQTQLAQCCCDNKSAIADVKYTIGSGFADANYNLATQANGITNAINTGFCQTNFNAQSNTRDIVDSQNAGTRAILDKLCQMETNAKDDKIAELTAKLSKADLAASQAAQNAYLVDKLGYHMPVAAYQVPNPFCNCNCNTGCGC